MISFVMTQRVLMYVLLLAVYVCAQHTGIVALVYIHQTWNKINKRKKRKQNRLFLTQAK